METINETIMVRVPGGSFLMGSNTHYPEEAPTREVRVDAFWMDATVVTNAEFDRFVADTGYITLAEKSARLEDYPDAKPELLAPSSSVFHRPNGPVDLRNAYLWWRYVQGANWRHPRGPDSSIDELMDHPVVHVAFEDAEAYAAWAGKEIPTEAEWEFAARGGIDGAEYVWGDELTPGGRVMANTWQGRFPFENLLEDGYEWTSPVRSFPANGFGLYDMAGNVWEWTADLYQDHRIAVKPCCSKGNPRGGGMQTSVHPSAETPIPRRVMKGGSYLCAPNYCHRYRPAARMAQAVDTSTCHLGFRCIARARKA